MNSANPSGQDGPSGQATDDQQPQSPSQSQPQTQELAQSNNQAARNVAILQELQQRQQSAASAGHSLPYLGAQITDQSHLAQNSENRDVLLWLDSIGIEYRLYLGGRIEPIIVLPRIHDAVQRGVFDAGPPDNNFWLVPSSSGSVMVLRQHPLAFGSSPISALVQRVSGTNMPQTKSSGRTSDTTASQAPIVPMTRSDGDLSQGNRLKINNDDAIKQQENPNSYSSMARSPVNQQSFVSSDTYLQSQNSYAQSYANIINAASIPPTGNRNTAPSPVTGLATQTSTSMEGHTTFDPGMSFFGPVLTPANASIGYGAPPTTSARPRARTIQSEDHGLLPGVQTQKPNRNTAHKFGDTTDQSVQEMGTREARNEIAEVSFTTPELTARGHGRGRARARGTPRGRNRRGSSGTGRGLQRDQNDVVDENDDTFASSPRRSNRARGRRARAATHSTPMRSIETRYGLPLPGALPPNLEETGFVEGQFAISYNGPTLCPQILSDTKVGPAYGMSHDGRTWHAPRGIFCVKFAFQTPGSEVFQFITDHRFDSPIIAGNFLAANVERIFWRNYSGCFSLYLLDPTAILPPFQKATEYHDKFYLWHKMWHSDLWAGGSVHLMQEVGTSTSSAPRVEQERVIEDANDTEVYQNSNNQIVDILEAHERQKAGNSEREDFAAAPQEIEAFQMETAISRAGFRVSHEAAAALAGPSFRCQPTAGPQLHQLPQSPIGYQYQPELPSHSQHLPLEPGFELQSQDESQFDPQYQYQVLSPIVAAATAAIPEQAIESTIETPFQIDAVPPSWITATSIPATPPQLPIIPADLTGFNISPDYVWPDWNIDDGWAPFTMFPASTAEEFGENPFGEDHGLDDAVNGNGGNTHGINGVGGGGGI